VNQAEPCLYFVRGWRNGRASAWLPMAAPVHDTRINDMDLQRIVKGSSYNEVAPSYWQNNPAYQQAIAGAASGIPSQTFAILKIPVRLVASLTEKQALELANQLNPFTLNNRNWHSRGFHSLATIDSLPQIASSASNFYRRGDAFFYDLKKYESINPYHQTLAHKYGFATPQHQQAAPVPKPAPVPPPAPPTRRAAPAANDPAPKPVVTTQPSAHTPSRNFNLQRRLGLKGTHPSPDGLKTLRKIWAAQKGKPEGEDTAPQPAPAGDKPETP